MKYDFDNWNIQYSTVESLAFMCRAALGEVPGEINGDEELLIELEESPSGTISLVSCSSGSLTVFQLKMFLDFDNRGKLIFLFDSIYEMMWKNVTEAIYLMESVRDYTRRHKMWITKVSYEIDEDCSDEAVFLEQEFGTAYVLEPFTTMDQVSFLNKFWKHKIQIKNFNSRQVQNVHYVHFMKSRTERSCLAVKQDYLSVYVIFFGFFENGDCCLWIRFSY